MEKEKAGLAVQPKQTVIHEDLGHQGRDKHGQRALHAFRVDVAQAPHLELDPAVEGADDLAKGVAPHDRHEGEGKEDAFDRVSVRRPGV